MMIRMNRMGNLNGVQALLLVASISLGACSSNDDSGDPIASTDEVETDVLNDPGTDGESDAGTDGESDTGTDGESDAGTDGESDAGTEGESDAGTDTEATTDSFAFAATASFPTGQIERISFSDGYTVNGTYPATESDIRADTDGNTLYQLGRFQLDSLTRFSTTDTSVVDYQYSVNGEETATNPHDVVFVSESKAYVLRYGSPKIWIINPSATTEADFKIGEIDLSAYDPDLSDEDLSPNATSGVIVNDKLFVLMQRLSGFNPVEQGYVAVFDTTSDTEIDTGKGEADSLNGIPLGTLNPTNIRYNEVTDEIYVTGRGNIFVEFNMLEADPYQGGLFAIDYSTYDINQLLDDGTAETNTTGFIERTLVINDEKGYVSMYASAAPEAMGSRTTLHTFNPSTGELGEAVATATGEISSLNMGSDGNVWIGINSPATPGFTRLNSVDNTIVEPYIATSFSPLNVVFIDVIQP